MDLGAIKNQINPFLNSNVNMSQTPSLPAANGKIWDWMST
jgi:hypothetical protein